MSDGVPTVHAKTAERERWAGTIFAFLSTFLYGVSNVAMRCMTGPVCEVDLNWILFYKESVGVLIVLPWLFFRLGQGRFRFVSMRLVVYILIAALLCQVIGARLQVLGYAVIGLIIAVPVIQSSILLGVAILGYLILGESLSRQRKAAIAVLIVAITLLSIGKALVPTEEQAANDTVNIVSAGVFLLVTLGTVVAGIIFAVYVMMIRYVLRQYWDEKNSSWQSFRIRRWIGYDYAKKPGERFYTPFPISLIMVLVFAVGVVFFGILIYGESGAAGFYDVPQVAWYCVLISGICNAVGFFFQLQGLRLTSAVQASLIAVSQMLLLSLVGFWFFAEAVNTLVLIGLGLTVYGIVMSAKPEK